MKWGNPVLLSFNSATTSACMVLLCVAFSLLASTAQAQFEVQPEKSKLVDPALSLDANSRLAWNREWSLYASRYTKIGDEYYACAKYLPAYPSSSHVTPEALVQRNTRTRTIRLTGNMSRDIKVAPNLVDAQAAAPALPSLAFGEYGHVHSVEIVLITGPQEMIVRQIWLIDEDKLKNEIDKLNAKAQERRDRAGTSRRDETDDIESNFQFRTQLVDHQRKQRDFRSQPVLLVGYDTGKLKADQRWDGPSSEGLELAIAGPKTIAYTRSSSGRPRDLEVVVALPVSQFKGRLSRDEFVTMLATRDLTLKQFVDFSTEEKKNDSEQALFNTIKRVEENRPLKEAASATDAQTEAQVLADGDTGNERSTRASRRKSRKAAAAEKAAAEKSGEAGGESSSEQPVNDQRDDD